MSESVDAQRHYRMRKRLEDVEDTRRRITEAAVELHGTVGPRDTTLSAVAELAGVQRSTVYRHFPDEDALFGACTSHWLARHPWPNTSPWTSEPDPVARLRRALGDLYRYYDANAGMMANSIRDAEVMPAFVAELTNAQLRGIHEVLLEPWVGGPGAHDIADALTMAIDFRTWTTLADSGLDPQAGAELMTRMVRGLSTETGAG